MADPAPSAQINYLDPANLAQFQNYSLLSKYAVEGFISGLHRSLFHGHGSEFFQYRNYAPGDDFKYIDWKVFSRHERFYTKLFEEETNMDLSVVLDISGSMNYQGQDAPVAKWQYAAMIAACLGYLAKRQGDNFGLYIYDDEVREAHPARHHSRQMQIFFSALQRIKPSTHGANHDLILDYLAQHLTRRGIVVVISDLLEAETSIASPLKRLMSQRRECLVFQVLDPDELDFPFNSPTQFIGLEDERRLITDPEEIREGYLAGFNQFLAALRSALNEAEVDHLLCRTSEDLGKTLAAYLHRRESLQ